MVESCWCEVLTDCGAGGQNFPPALVANGFIRIHPKYEHIFSFFLFWGVTELKNSKEAMLCAVGSSSVWM